MYLDREYFKFVMYTHIIIREFSLVMYLDKILRGIDHINPGVLQRLNLWVPNRYVAPATAGRAASQDQPTGQDSSYPGYLGHLHE